jgi:hypothetical protein
MGVEIMPNGSLNVKEEPFMWLSNF